jgi:hypothetical protein
MRPATGSGDSEEGRAASKNSLFFTLFSMKSIVIDRDKQALTYPTAFYGPASF